MTTHHPELHTLTGAYALDALDDDERDAFEAHLPDCGTCREEVDGFLATAAMLGGAVADTPPASMKASVLDQVARSRQDAPGAERPRRPSTVTSLRGRRSATARRAWLDRLVVPAAAVLAIVVAGMAIVVGNLNRRLDTVVAADEVASVVASADLETWQAEMPDGGTVRVVYSPSRGEGWFLADGMEGADRGKTYELWLIDDDGPAPAGLFQAADGRAAHAFTGDVGEATAIGVTVEPASGSPEPTTDPIVVVEL